MAHEVSLNVFCDDLNANFQRGSARIVDGGEKGDKLADMDGLTEGNLVYGHRDDAQDIGLRRRRQPDPSASGWCRHAHCRQSLPCPESLVRSLKVRGWVDSSFVTL